MLLSPLLCLIVVVAGVMIGSIGIGGVLQVPALHYLGGIPMHTIVPACMLAYLVPGLVGGVVYHRHGSMHWPAARRICLGAIPGAFLGAWLLPMAPAVLLECMVALMILYSGMDALRMRNRQDGAMVSLADSSYIAVGFVTGLISALTGAGGPLTLVPLLVWLRLPVRIIVGLGQVIQVPIALMATLGNLRNDAVDIKLSLTLAVLLSLGVIAGGMVAHRLPEKQLKKIVAVLLVLVGLAMIARLFTRLMY